MPEPEPEASAPQQEAVRRLLAQARATEPAPPAVVARLDAVLAQLADEGPHAVDPPPPPATRSDHATVVDLGAQRRRRVRGLLGAAAAVVVLGIGVTQVVDLTGEQGSDDSSAASETADDAGADSDAGGSTAAEPARPPGSQAPESLTGATLPRTVPEVARRGFRDSVVRLRDADFATSLDDRTPLGAAELTSDPLFVCPPTVWGPGRLVPVSYTGAPAVLVYRPATGDTQSVELLQCGTGAVLRSVVIPFP